LEEMANPACSLGGRMGLRLCLELRKLARTGPGCVSAFLLG
jgi:hypothetical protein